MTKLVETPRKISRREFLKFGAFATGGTALAACAPAMAAPPEQAAAGAENPVSNQGVTSAAPTPDVVATPTVTSTAIPTASPEAKRAAEGPGDITEKFTRKLEELAKQGCDFGHAPADQKIRPDWNTGLLAQYLEYKPDRTGFFGDFAWTDAKGKSHGPHKFDFKVKYLLDGKRVVEIQLYHGNTARFELPTDRTRISLSEILKGGKLDYQEDGKVLFQDISVWDLAARWMGVEPSQITLGNRTRFEQTPETFGVQADMPFVDLEELEKAGGVVVTADGRHQNKKCQNLGTSFILGDVPIELYPGVKPSEEARIVGAVFLIPGTTNLREVKAKVQELGGTETKPAVQEKSYQYAADSNKAYDGKTVAQRIKRTDDPSSEFTVWRTGYSEGDEGEKYTQGYLDFPENITHHIDLAKGTGAIILTSGTIQPGKDGKVEMIKELSEGPKIYLISGEVTLQGSAGGFLVRVPAEEKK